MELRGTSLVPSSNRLPFFDGWETTRACYEANCGECGGRINIPFSAMLHGAWGWKEQFGETDAPAIEAHFQLAEHCKALAGGWPSVSLVACTNCGTKHIFYADFDEYHNSVYRIVAQGLAVCVA
jgi:hypothetical protein